MPVLDALPHLTIIRGLKGILDFYYWKGIPCVRKWPVIPPSSRSPRSLESARLFGAIVAAYSLLGAVLKELFALNAADQPRTARDLFVSAVLGHLHDHNMSDFLDLLTEATAYLGVIANLANALNAVATDELRVKPGYDGGDYFPLLLDAQRHLQADILASALPTDAATDANQDTIIARLTLITKLEHALESVHTDRLKVRGEDQLDSFKSVLAFSTGGSLSADDGYIESAAVPEGQIWKITAIAALNNNRATTAHAPLLVHNGGTIHLGAEARAFAINDPSRWSGTIWADYQDTVRVYMTGGLNTDSCYIYVTGHRMTLEP